MKDVPPPVVDIGPTNQTLATRSAATLPCQASGIPLPTIKWYRNGNYLSPDDPRVTITSSGTLQIDGKFDLNNHFFQEMKNHLKHENKEILNIKYFLVKITLIIMYIHRC